MSSPDADVREWIAVRLVAMFVSLPQPVEMPLHEDTR